MLAVEKVLSSFLRRRTTGMSEKLSYLAVTMTAVKSVPKKQTGEIWVGFATPPMAMRTSVLFQCCRGNFSSASVT
jgi:hypothetical protein